MGFFSKKAAPINAPASVAPVTGQAAASPRPNAAPPSVPSAVDNPKTMILSFLHESSKNTGMRDFVKNYVFHHQGDHRYLVLVEMKEGCSRLPTGALMARWQLFQLGAMRWAMSKAVPLQGLACVFPVDKSTPLAQLQDMAQLQWGKEAGAEQAFASTLQPNESPAQQARMAAAGPETQIEVDDNSAEAAEEFFRLTQPPSQS